MILPSFGHGVSSRVGYGTVLLNKSTTGIDYNFTTGSLPSGVTLTRASSGTYFNSSGALSTASSDAARFDHDPISHAALGILIEPQSTNYIPYSNSFSSWGAWENPVLSTGFSSPDGGTNASKLCGDASTGAHQVYYSDIDGYAFSVFSKSAGYSVLIERLCEWPTQFPPHNIISHFPDSLYYNGLSGSSLSVITSSAGFNRFCVANPETRINLVGISTTSDTTFTGNNDTSYLGDGASGIYIFGAQLESSTTCTSYIPTSGSASTRSADVLQFTIPSGVSTLRYTFDDDTTQDVSVSAGAYTVPTNLNRAWIKRIQSV